MCGRVVNTHTPAEIAAALHAEDRTEDLVVPDFNVGPTRLLPAVLERVEDGTPVRQVRSLKWGLVPSWAKDPSIGNRMINARVETVATKPAFRKAMSKRRCLVTVSGFYEWQVTDDGKQPWFIQPAGGGLLTLAGLYERWSDAEGRVIRSCAVITTTADDDLGELHDRAPMFVPEASWDVWLDPSVESAEELTHLLVPAVPGTFSAHPVDKAVGNVRNNYPSLIEPVPL